jgi:hypothetical protein
MPERKGKKATIASFKASRKNVQKKPDDAPKPLVIRVTGKLKEKITSVAAFREKHLSELARFQQAVDDNNRAINNLVIGYLAGHDDAPADLENYDLVVDDAITVIILSPKPPVQEIEPGKTGTGIVEAEDSAVPKHQQNDGVADGEETEGAVEGAGT